MPEPTPDPIDDAVSRRLSRLRTVPLETAAFDAALRSALPPAAIMASQQRGGRWRLWTPVRAVAAAVLLAATLALSYLTLSPSPALATPERMAEVHQTAVEGTGRSTPIRTIDEARAALHEKWPQSPTMPEPPGMPLMSCCVHEIGRKQMACLTFTVDQTPLTLAVASTRDIRSPQGDRQVIGGQSLVVGSSGGVNMVMSEADGTWMCLMGRLPVERLAEVAQSIRN